MEQLLLNIIIVLTLALVVVIYAVRLIFRVSHPFSAGVVSAGAAPVRSGSGGGSPGAFIIVLLLAGLAFLSLRPDNDGASNNGVDREIPGLPPLQDPAEELPPTLAPETPLIVNGNEYVNVLADEWEVDRYNQAPTRAGPTVFYAIQLGAFKEEKNAREGAAEWSATEDNLLLVYVPGDVPFKLVVGPFSSREAAKQYQADKLLKGFITLIDRHPGH